MPKARKQQIFLSETPYYHCVSRCVRRAFLCGFDKFTNHSFDHRREWVEKRLLFLSSVYAIDVCAFAVMSNHTHIVLKVNSDKAKGWSNKQVLASWHKLHFGTLLTRQYCQDAGLDEVLLPTVNASVEVYRERLSNISWFMRDLNEYIARMANAEDNCTGRFWEGRFRCQALLDEAALIACMAYVDLNPIRANMAKSLNMSNHTSIQQRIKAALNNDQPAPLLPFTGGESLKKPIGIFFELQDYLTLVDATGRCIRKDKNGSISKHEELILTKLSIIADNWLTISQRFEQLFTGAVGKEESLTHHIQHAQLKRRPNYRNSQQYLA
ncbi:transposase [Thalassotalea sp. 42_200_T64]|nr:transposase [Thalassotalea sp. 42_200_T64]